MKTEELIAAAERLVKELQGASTAVGWGSTRRKGRPLEMVNWIGDEMVQEVVAGLTEPTTANQITVSGEVAARDPTMATQSPSLSDTCGCLRSSWCVEDCGKQSVGVFLDRQYVVADLL